MPAGIYLCSILAVFRFPTQAEESESAERERTAHACAHSERAGQKELYADKEQAGTDSERESESESCTRTHTHNLISMLELLHK